MQYHTLSSKKSHGGDNNNVEVVFKRNTIPRQYMDLVHEKFANQRQEVMDTITQLRTQIRATSIDTEAGQLKVFQTNKAMKAAIEHLKTINKRQEKSNFLTRDYKVAKSIETKEMLEAAMTLEIEAIHMKNQQQHQQHHDHDHQSSTITSTMKSKKNNKNSNVMVRQVQSQLSLTRLQKYNLKKQLKKQQRESETRQEQEPQQQDSDTTTITDSTTRSNTSSSSSYINTPDVVPPSPPPSPATPSMMKRSVSMGPGIMMKRTVSFSTFTDVKMVPSVLDLLEADGQCESSNATAKDNIWYDKRDFCGFAQKEMSRRSDLGITSTSALHSHVGRSSDSGDSEID
eukprot:CAMPEP_0170988666 /NCGR_PEP_ID=MMETSP0736-20130129/7290_1 /TAXON_ID=186038 /ORGANISM="Fragilariopsis kerguelensis, Strain L26-C5" /LENGTH=342 /DNA_ID=CAMNT_0011412989 /DNA_START=197 /DNA_END=1225 /DNA_ORIENTATION=-